MAGAFAALQRDADAALSNNERDFILKVLGRCCKTQLRLPPLLPPPPPPLADLAVEPLLYALRSHANAGSEGGAAHRWACTL